jgi:glycopeptide antibiotics resistance protein
MKTGNELMIPEMFKPLKLNVLDLPSHDFLWSRSLIQDVMINIIMFIPFGFFCAGLLGKTHRLKISTLYVITAFLGFVVSLTIEMLQVYLPTRDSSLTDVICNVLGAIMGLVLYQTTVFSSHETAYE